MFARTILLLLLIVICSCQGRFFPDQERIGGNEDFPECVSEAENTSGYCVSFNKCPKAIKNLFEKGQKPTKCSLSSEVNVDDDNVICCPKDEKVSTITTNNNKNDIAIDQRTIRNPENIVLTRRSASSATSSSERLCEKECRRLYSRNYVETPNPEEEEEESIERWQWSSSKTRKARTAEARKNVVAGVQVFNYEFPFMCALGWNTSDLSSQNFAFNCGCVLIAPRFVLTAAHCTSFAGSPPIVARIGGKYLNDSIGEERYIDRIIIHPEYRKHSLYNDIAIMRLRAETRHKPACLWSHGDVSERGLIALGYGQTSFAGPVSDSLLKVFLKSMPKDQCYEYYSREIRLRSGFSEGHLCAHDPAKRMDTCQGDSGGPLLTEYFQYLAFVPYVVGLTSFGIGCANGIPSIYTQVSHYLDWIESNVWQ